MNTIATAIHHRRPALRLARTGAAAILALCAAAPAPAATKYFDVTAGAGNGVGGSGTLATQTAALFSNAATGDATLSAAAATDDGVFQGTAGTVTLGATFTLNSAAFNVTGYTLTPDSTTARTFAAPVSLAANVNLNLDDAAATANRTLNLNGNVTGLTGATLTIQGAQTSVNAARVNLNAANVTISIPTTISTTGAGGAGFAATAAGTGITGAITNNSVGATLIGATGSSSLLLAFTAVISGSAGLQFSAGASGGAGVVTLNAQNTYAGATTFNAAVGGIIRLGVNNALPTGTTVTMAASASNGGVLDLNGFNQTIASLTSGAGGGGITNGNQAAAATSLSTLTINGAASPAAFALNITDGTGTTPGQLALVRGGTGTTTLAGTGSTYSGGTQVNGGTLLVTNASGSGTGTGSVTVNNSGSVLGGGTATGAGGISGAVTVNANAKIAPGTAAVGTTPGTTAILGTGALTLQASSLFAADLTGAAAGTAYDQINVTGAVSLAGTLTITAGSFVPNGTDKFFLIVNDGTDAVLGQFASTAGVPAGYGLDYFADSATGALMGGNDVALVPVPEPGTVAAALLTLGALGWTRRNQVRRSFAVRRRLPPAV